MYLSENKIKKMLKDAGFYRVSCDVEHLKNDFSDTKDFRRFVRFVNKNMNLKPLTVHYRDLKPYVEKFMREIA
jgi:hypothetical protein